MEKSIQFAMKMRDEVSGIMSGITNSLSMTIEALDDVGKASKDSFDDRSIKAAREELKNTEALLKELSPIIDDNTDSQDNFNDELARGQREAEQLTNKIIATATAMFGIAKGVKMLRSGLNTFKDYEIQMKTVKAVTSATEKEFQMLNQSAKNMSGFYLPKEVAQGYEELARRGWDAMDIIQGSGDVLNLAIGNTMELGRTAEITSDILDGFNYGVEETNRVVNVLTYTAANASTDVDLLGDSFAQSSAIARTFGADIEQVATIYGMISSSSKGQRAGTGIRSALLSMSKMTDEAEAMLDHLNVSFIDPTTNSFKDLGDIVSDLHYAFEDLSNSAQLEAAQTLFGSGNPANAMLEVISQGPAEFEKWMDSFENMGDVALEQAKEIMDSTQYILNSHESAMDIIWIDFYEGLSELSGDSFESVLSILETSLSSVLNIVSAIINTVGGIYSIFQEVLEPIIPMIITFITVMTVAHGVIKLVAFAQEILNIAVKSNPIVFMISLILSLIAALVHLWKTNDDFAIGVMRTWHNVLNWFDMLPFHFYSIAEGILESFSSWIEPAIDSFNKAFNWIIDGINKVKSAINSLTGSSITMTEHIDFGNILDDALGKLSANKYAALDKANILKEKRALSLDEFKAKRAMQADVISGLDLANDPMAKELGNISDLGGKALGELGKGNKKLGKIKDKVDISVEDIKLLRDAAEERSINRFTNRTIAPVQIEFTGNIDRSTDFDEVATKLKEHLQTELNVSAEGVHS